MAKRTTVPRKRPAKRPVRQSVTPAPKLAVHPVTPDRWDDVQSLFGEKGACAGCWCMYWRVPRSLFNKGKGAGNRRAMGAIVADGRVPGLLGYVDAEPVAWCTVAPREEFGGLDRSRVLKRVDEAEVWSIPCFFIARGHRRQGLSVKMIDAAVAYATSQGAKIVEGYPVEPSKGEYADAFAYTGLASAFRKAGFREVARRSPTRPIMRRNVETQKQVR